LHWRNFPWSIEAIAADRAGKWIAVPDAVVINPRDRLIDSSGCRACRSEGSYTYRADQNRNWIQRIKYEYVTKAFVPRIIRAVSIVGPNRATFQAASSCQAVSLSSWLQFGHRKMRISVSPAGTGKMEIKCISAVQRQSGSSVEPASSRRSNFDIMTPVGNCMSIGVGSPSAFNRFSTERVVPRPRCGQ
jgi:hypothetical protein